MSDESTVLPIRQAAKKVHKSRAYVRSLVESGDVQAYRDGGPDHAPRLSVCWKQVEQVMKWKRIYTPPGLLLKKKQLASRRRIFQKPLHPKAAAI